MTLSIKWAPYVFVRLTLYLMAGMLLAIHSSINLLSYQLLQYLFIGLLGVYWVLYVCIKFIWRTKRIPLVYGLFAFLIITLFGFLLTYQRTASTQANHIIHSNNDFTYYSGSITSQVQERVKNYKAELAIDKIYLKGKWKKASGKVIIFLDKQSRVPAYGSRLLIKGTPQVVAAPVNPEEFNYRKYLRYQQIYHQHMVKKSNYVIYAGSTPNPVLAWSIQLRQQADKILKNLITTQNEYAIASGLILGIRDGLDNEIKQAYASAGAMHVLAVSGAHIAIVFQFLVLLLSRLKSLKYGSWAFALIVLCILWLYAFVTGLSASVLRAVVMFTFIVIAQASRRQSNIYNTLALSAFVLLCYDPFLLMDVGFQLSYVAVLGIIYLYPKLNGLFDFNYWLANKAWAITCVSVAAMIATVPMSLFYFHQFPTYFLLSNLPVIILSSCILYVGLVTLLLSWVPYVSVGFGYVLQQLVWMLNQSVFMTESLPGALIGGISINLIQTLLLYALIVFVLLFLHYKKLAIWRIVFGTICMLVVLQCVESIRQKNQQQLAIYGINNQATLSIIRGKKHIFFATKALQKDHSSINFHLANHWWSHGITESTFIEIPPTNISNLAFQQMNGYHLLVWQGKTFVFLHQPVFLQPAFFQLLKTDYLVVQNNSIDNLELLQGQFTQLIIDSSNKTYIAKRLKEQARNLNIPCYWVMEDGAFILKD